MKASAMLLSALLLTFSVGGFSSPAFSADVPEAKPDKGLVVFYRERQAKGAALRFQISDDSGQAIGSLSNGSMFHVDLSPGQHSFNVRAPSMDGSDRITLNIEAGQTYYVQGVILWGWPTGRPKFNRVGESQAVPSIGNL